MLPRLAWISLLATSLATAQTPLRTVAERSNYTETSKHADVMAFGRDLAANGRVWSTTYGTSQNGQPLPLLVLGTGGQPAQPADVAGKLVLMAFANIHAGEVDGKEALLALARDLAAGWDQPKWKNIVLLLAPNINPDGNDRIDPRNRIEQNGPRNGVGTRENADGLDLNRDFVKLESPEIRQLVNLIETWDPRIVIDCHTTNGSYHRYTLTYDGPRYPAAHPELIAYTAETLLPDAGRRVKAATGFDTFWYGNFDRERTEWQTYPATPRFGVQWLALRGRFGILSESYSYASFKDRVSASYHFVNAIFEHAAANAREIRELTDKAALPPDAIALRSKPVSALQPVSIMGFVEQVQDGRKRPTAQLKDYPCKLVLRMDPTESASRPFAYAIPQRFGAAVEVLQRHGITVSELREDATVPVTASVVVETKTAERAYQKHHVRSLTTKSNPPAPRSIPAGSFIVTTDQPLGRLASYLLEAHAEDGLAVWNFFDEGLAGGREYPVTRIEKPVALLTGPTAPLPEHVKPPLPITFAVAAQIPQVGAGAFTGVTWLPDGDHFLQVKAGKLAKVNARTGASEDYFQAKLVKQSIDAIKDVNKETADRILNSRTFRYTPQQDGFLVDLGADVAVVYFDGRPAVKLTSDGKPKEFPTFSPDGAYLAYVQNGNLFTVSVASKAVVQLTADGGANDILNGRGDWVYEEEIFNRRGRTYWWSPDSKQIAFMRFDDKPVPKFAITDFTPNGGKLELWNYPKSGEPNPLVSIGVAKPTGGPVAFLKMGEYKPADTVISRVDWTPANQVYAYVQNREQTWLDFCTWPDPNGAPVKLFRDQTKAWIDDQGEAKFLADGSFLFPSERSGYKHLYHYSARGELLKPVTTGEWDAKSIVRVDEADGWIYVTGNKDGFLRTHFYRVRLKDGTLERISPAGGTHTVNLAPQGPLYTIISSDNDKPPTASLKEIGGGEVRTLDNNPARDRGRVQMLKTERVQIPLADGFVLEGAITYPPDFDPKKKYPVWVMTYAGPHAPTVRDGWSGRTADSALARNGVVLFRVDPRSASGKGAIAHWTCWRQLGVQELKDLEESIAWLGKKFVVDEKHVGISGHSYGGYISAYALTHGKTFTAGIASGPVTDWHLYDTIYTERYMGVPKDNPQGYEASSVLKAAKNLHGQLLIMHGMIDDNVHVQNAMQLVDALQRANKPFELMVYPRNRHGIGGPHYSRTQQEFMLRAMGVTEKAGDKKGE
jgi:dipeptidyl aminopeptidase/acylaminoacyl peptidase